MSSFGVGLLVPMGISNFGIHVLPGLQYMYVNTMAMKSPVPSVGVKKRVTSQIPLNIP